jgi:single-stranded DNA-binding protein
MNGLAEFKLIGHIGEIKQVGSTVHISIASNYSYKDSSGEWQNKTHWNDVTIFRDATQRYVLNNLGKGDFVHVTGTPYQSSYESDGRRIYQTTFACDQIDRWVKAESRAEEKPQEEPANLPKPASRKRRAAALVDENIPF